MTLGFNITKATDLGTSLFFFAASNSAPLLFKKKAYVSHPLAFKNYVQPGGKRIIKLG